MCTIFHQLCCSRYPKLLNFLQHVQFEIVGVDTRTRVRQIPIAMHDHVSFQVLLHFENLSTYLTSNTRSVLMLFLVVFKSTRVCKSFSTLLATMRLLSCVKSCVNNQIMLRLVTLTADVAREVFFPCVPHSVNVECCSCRKTLCAYVTYNVPFMNRFEVIPHELVVCKHLSTFATLPCRFRNILNES